MAERPRPSRGLSEWSLAARHKDSTVMRWATCKGSGFDPAYISLSPYKACPAGRGFGC
jgi:hypothetical protein